MPNHGSCAKPLGSLTVDVPHFHGQLEILLVTRGSVSLVAGRREVVVPAGHIAWILPGIQHWVRRDSDDVAGCLLEVSPHVAGRALHLEPPMDAPFRAWLDRLCKSLSGRMLAAPDPVEVSELVDLALLGQRTSPDSTEWLQTVVARAHAMSTRCLVSEEVLGLAYWVPPLLATDPFLDRSQAARRIGVSEAYLTRLVRRELGVSFEVQRNRTRLVSFLAVVSAARLAQKRISLLDASFAAGFGSYSQMHRIFVGALGTGPGEYLLGDEHRVVADGLLRVA